jgi:transposase InsO family protein
LCKFVRTTDSAHDGPIFPNLARGFRPTGPHQLWVGDITYIRIAAGFVYLAVILDAWSRRVIGYAIGRQIDTRLALAALRSAIEIRQPPRGCIHHSDRGVQGEFKRSSQHLERGNCDNYSKAPFGLVRASTVAVAGPASGSTTGELSAVLGIDCGRPFK